MTNLAVIGHNNPPEPTPFEAVQARINDLYGEAKLWLDGDPIKTQSQADALNTLASHIKAAASEAETLRKAEVKPFDDGKAEVQARFNVLIGETKSITGLTVKALDAVKAALKPYLLELDRQQQEAARTAREEAEKTIAEARAAIRATDAANLEARDHAEQLLSDAKDLERDANRLAKAKPQAHGEGRAVGLRTVYTPIMLSYRDAAAWAFVEKKAELETFLMDLAKAEIRAGKRNAWQGFAVKEEKVI
jgi:hypothetical protein